MISSFLMFSSLLHWTQAAHVTQKTVKPKRGLYGISDQEFFHPVPPPPQEIPVHPTQIPVAVAIPEHQIQPKIATPVTLATISPQRTRKTFLNTNILDFDDDAYFHWFNKLNGFNPYYGPPPQQILPQPNNLFGGGFNYVNYGFPINNQGAPHDHGTYVTSDGRIVKQYAVMETHIDDIPNDIDYNPPRPGFVPSQYNPRPPIYVPNNIRNPPNTRVPTFLNRNHGPVALGSGGVGFIQRENGEIFLGSGSLAYISQKNHYDMVLDINSRRQKAQQAGLTSFGHSL